MVKKNITTLKSTLLQSIIDLFKINSRTITITTFFARASSGSALPPSAPSAPSDRAWAAGSSSALLCPVRPALRQILPWKTAGPQIPLRLRRLRLLGL